MNRTPHDDLERLLSAGLADRADRMADSRLSMAGIRDRAGRITRRRRLGVAAGTVAALAVLAPTAPAAYVALSGDREPDPPVVAPSLDPDVVVDYDEGATAPGPGELGLRGIDQGPGPAVAWLRDGVVSLPSARQVEPESTLSDVFAFGHLASSDRYLFAGTDPEGRQVVQVVDGVGEERTQHLDYPLEGGLAASPDGSQIGWTNPEGEVLVLHEERDEPTVLGPVRGENPQLATITGEDCAAQVLPGTSGGCSVYVNVAVGEQHEPQVRVASTTGADGRLDGLRRVTGAFQAGDPNDDSGGSTNLVAGITDIADGGTCSTVFDYFTPEGSDGLFDSCETGFGQFSPGGGLVEATAAYSDALGDGEIGMYDVATGTELWRRQATEQNQAFLHSTVWEDEEHLLAVAYQDGAWSVVRFGADGSIERALPPIAGEDTQPAYLLQARP